MMNDDSLTSDDLFKSGSTNGFSGFASGISDLHNGNLASYITEQRLHPLSEKIQEDNETQVKDIDAIDCLTESLESLTLSTDGDDYTDIHRQNGFHDKLEIDAAGSQELNENTANVSGLKQPDLPINNLIIDQQIEDQRGSQTSAKQVFSLENRGNTFPKQVSHSRNYNTRHAYTSQNVGNDNIQGIRDSISEIQPQLPVYNMADSGQPPQPQAVPCENGVGARLKVRDTENTKSKTKKHGKIGSATNDHIPDPPFKLQQKKYDNEEDSERSTFPADELASMQSREVTENLTFPVEFLNPYSNPQTIKTIKPGGRRSPEYFGDSVQVSGKAVQVVRPKVYGKTLESESAVRGLRHNSSDPKIHNKEKELTNRNRNSTDISSLAVNFEDVSVDDRNAFSYGTPKSRFQQTVDNGLNSNAKQDHKQEVAIKQVVRPKEGHSSDTSSQVVESNSVFKPAERNKEIKSKDTVNMDLQRSIKGRPSNSPPTIEYINNLDTCKTKKIKNKDMKNTNRSKNTERNLSSNLANTDCSSIENIASVQNNQQKPCQNFDSVIDLQNVNRNLPNSANFVDRLNQGNNSNTETHPIIVPYEPRTNPPTVVSSFDESLSSLNLFGDGTEMNDHTFAKMLQEKYDKEHEEICQRNRFDLPPETLLLPNHLPNTNVADSSASDPSLFGEILQPDSLLNSLELDSDSMNPFGSSDAENHHYIDQYCPEVGPELTPVGSEDENSGDELLVETEQDDRVSPRYETEHHREVVAPETPDYEPRERTDEDYARSLQRQMDLEAREEIEEIARQMEEEERRERLRSNDYRSPMRTRERHMGPEQSLRSRIAMWERRQEPPRGAEGRRIYNTWDRPPRYGGRQRISRQRAGYDIFGNEYEPDDGDDDDYVSISRDPHLLRTVLMGRAPNMMVPDTVNLDDYEALWDLAEELGEVRRVGMDQQEISLLPVHTYQAQNVADGASIDNGDCRVCLTDFTPGEKLRTLPCLHIYHVDCIDEWLKRNAVCPVCRQSLRQ